MGSDTSTVCRCHHLIAPTANSQSTNETENKNKKNNKQQKTNKTHRSSVWSSDGVVHCVRTGATAEHHSVVGGSTSPHTTVKPTSTQRSAPHSAQQGVAPTPPQTREHWDKHLLPTASSLWAISSGPVPSPRGASSLHGVGCGCLGCFSPQSGDAYGADREKKTLRGLSGRAAAAVAALAAPFNLCTVSHTCSGVSVPRLRVFSSPHRTRVFNDFFVTHSRRRRSLSLVFSLCGILNPLLRRCVTVSPLNR